MENEMRAKIRAEVEISECHINPHRVQNLLSGSF